MKGLNLVLAVVVLSVSSACNFEANWQVGSDPDEQSVPASKTGPVVKAELRTRSGSATTQFAPNEPEIVCAWDVDGVKEGMQIVGTWIAVETAVTAPNQKIDEKGLALPGPATGTFTLTKSPKDWPSGSYRLEITIDGTLVKTVPFTIA